MRSRRRPTRRTRREAERLVFSRVLALAERYARRVRLVIVPAGNVFDAVVATAVRLRASDVYVGESATISADAQARLLGEAWERAGTPDLQLRLVVFHRSGRSDIYHLGPHAPELSARDLDLIHRIWLDADEERRSARAPPRHRQGSVDHHGRTTERSRARRGAAGHTGDSPACRRARRDASNARLPAPARHGAEPSAERSRRAAGGSRSRRPGGGVPAAAAQGRGGDVRVPGTGRPRSAAQDALEGRRRRAAQQHGARRSHDVPRGTAGHGHARAAGAADAAGARDRGHAARLSREIDRPADDAGLRRGARRAGRSSRCSTTCARTARTARRSTSSTSSTSTAC